MAVDLHRFHHLLNEALAHCVRALALHRELGNEHGEATVWDSLGYIHRLCGRNDQAVDCYRRAVRHYRGAADRPNEAEVLIRLGDIYQATGRGGDARHSWESALAALNEIGDATAVEVERRLATGSAQNFNHRHP